MLWVKSLHIIFMVTWFAGLFYLPRLYVYHAEARDKDSIERFKIMERKLFWGITTPGGILTLGFGIWLAVIIGPALLDTLWFQLKLGFVMLLVIYHIWCGRLLLNFKYDNNQHSHVWYRWFNEVPVAFLFVIIFLVELQPS